MARILSAAIELVATLALSACGPDVITDPVAGVIVYGRVTDTTGAAVAGASVLIGTTPDSSCVPDRQEGALSTDSIGDYIHALFNFGTPHPECIKVVVLPPLGVLLAPDSVIRKAVPFTSKGDSVRIDFVLRPSA